MSNPAQYSYNLVPGLLTQSASNKSSHSTTSNLQPPGSSTLKHHIIAQHSLENESSSTSTSPLPALPIAVLSQTRSGPTINPTELTKMFTHVPNSTLSRTLGLSHHINPASHTNPIRPPLNHHRSSHTQSYLATSLTSGSYGHVMQPSAIASMPSIAIAGVQTQKQPHQVSSALPTNLAATSRHLPLSVGALHPAASTSIIMPTTTGALDSSTRSSSTNGGKELGAIIPPLGSPGHPFMRPTFNQSSAQSGPLSIFPTSQAPLGLPSQPQQQQQQQLDTTIGTLQRQHSQHTTTQQMNGGDDPNVILPLAPQTLSPVPSLGLSSPGLNIGSGPFPLFRTQLQPMSSVLVVQDVDDVNNSTPAADSGAPASTHPLAVSHPGAPLPTARPPLGPLSFPSSNIPVETGGILVRPGHPPHIPPGHPRAGFPHNSNIATGNRRITSLSATPMPAVAGHPPSHSHRYGTKLNAPGTTPGYRQPPVLRPSQQQQQQQHQHPHAHSHPHQSGPPPAHHQGGPTHPPLPNVTATPVPPQPPAAPTQVYYYARNVLRHNMKPSLPPSHQSDASHEDEQLLPPAAAAKLLKRIVVNRELADSVASYSSAASTHDGGQTTGKGPVLNQFNKRPRPPSDDIDGVGPFLDDFTDSQEQGGYSTAGVGLPRRRPATPYGPAEKNARLARWYEKRNVLLSMTDQDFQNAAVAGKYTVRKRFAEERPRKGGRFIKKSEAEKILQQQRKEEDERRRKAEQQRKEDGPRVHRVPQQQQQQQQPQQPHGVMHAHAYPHHGQPPPGTAAPSLQYTNSARSPHGSFHPAS